jgi:predicted GNAT superfamily acetyltransferase
VFYCPHCKKNVGIFHCHTLAVHIADFTSSISVDIIGEHAETLIELKSAEFCEFSHEKQLAHLDDLKYKNVTLKLKTEHKEKNKKESHSVWAVDHSTAINSLKEIHKKLEGRKAIAIKN